uniref:(northern house mosquito) hypothetical protein n=1 Tax=Culex pipiens TaxID=7175 RepID=A0A8D8E0X7_CULPI
MEVRSIPKNEVRHKHSIDHHIKLLTFQRHKLGIVHHLLGRLHHLDHHHRQRLQDVRGLLQKLLGHLAGVVIHRNDHLPIIRNRLRQLERTNHGDLMTALGQPLQQGLPYKHMGSAGAREHAQNAGRLDHARKCEKDANHDRYGGGRNR